MKREIDIRIVQFRREMQQWQTHPALDNLVEETGSIFKESTVTRTDFKFWREGHIGAHFARLIGADGIRLIDPDPPDLEVRIGSRILQIEVGEALSPGRRRHDEYRQKARIQAALENAEPVDCSDRQMAANWALPAAKNSDEKTALHHLKIAQELTAEERSTIAQIIRGDPKGRRMRHTPITRSDDERIISVRESLETLTNKKSSKGYDKNISLLIYLNAGTLALPTSEVESVFPTATSAARHSFSEVWILWQNCAYQIWRNGERSMTRFPPLDHP